MSQRAQDVVRAILHEDLFALPTGATVRRLRALEEAARVDLAELDVNEHDACATLRAYLLPRNGEGDRAIGARVRAERRWHLVTMAAATLIRAVYRRSPT